MPGTATREFSGGDGRHLLVTALCCLHSRLRARHGEEAVVWLYCGTYYAVVTVMPWCGDVQPARERFDGLTRRHAVVMTALLPLDLCSGYDAYRGLVRLDYAKMTSLGTNCGQWNTILSRVAAVVDRRS